MGTHRSGYYKVDYAGDMALYDTPWRKLFLAGLVGLALLAPAIIPSYVVYIANHLFIAIMGALALNLLSGYAGQLSLGHAAFLAVGAFLGHYLASQGIPFVLVIPLVMLIGALLGVIVGAPALRLRGLYLVMGTVGFHFIVAYLINDYQTQGVDMLQALTGLVMPNPELGFVTLDNMYKWYFALLAFLAATTFFCVNLVRTRPGRAWIALRDRDITAAALGINVARYKILAFAVSSALTCMTGSLLAYFVGSVSAEYFTLSLAIMYLAMIVIGGAGTILGAYLGAILVGALPHLITAFFTWIDAPSRIQMVYGVPTQVVIFGLVMIFFLIFEPRGLVGVWGRIRTYFELWPLRQSILTERRT